MQDFNIRIVGHLSSGLTAFIQSVQRLQIATDRLQKVVYDGTFFARLNFEEFSLRVYPELPEHRGMEFEPSLLGIILCVKSFPNEADPFWRETRHALIDLQDFPLPYMVVCNFADHPDAWTPEEMRIALQLDEPIPLVACAATQRESVREALLIFLEYYQRCLLG